MSAYMLLLKTQLKLGITAFSSSFSGVSKNKFVKYLMLALILFAFAEIFGMYGLMIYFLTDAFIKAGQTVAFLTIVILMCQVITLFFGLFQVMGSLYYAKDTQFLASLPVKQSTVFASKLSVTMLYQLLVLLPFAAVPFVIVGIKTGAAVIFYLKALLVFIALPVLPLAIVSLLALVLMRITALAKHRDVITIVSSVVLVFAGIFASQWFSKMSIESKRDEILSRLLSGGMDLSEIYGTIFPPSIWASHAVMQSGLSSLGNMLLYLVSATILFAVILLLASKVYYRGVTAGLETANSSRKTKGGKLDTASHSAVNAIFVKEWRILLRIPIYALNGLTSVFIVPIMLIIMGSTGSNSSDPNFTMLMNTINQNAGISVSFIIAGVMCFFAGINPAASTVYSREGSAYGFLKSFPISETDIIKGKFLFSFSISASAIIFSSIALYFIFPIKIVYYIISLVLSLMASVILTVVNIYVDYRRPKLDWVNFQQAIKQNFNSVLGMLFSAAIIIVYGFIVYGLLKLPINQIVSCIIVFLLLTAGCIYSVRFLFKQKTM
ncbi:MAG: hypothetical protein Q8865_07925 [Bacillota bacterium]|nr:hypothetical protein [Bacillota bacterium]